MYGYEDYIDYADYAEESVGIFAGLAAGFGAMWFFSIVIMLISIISMWKIFNKAGKPGVAAIVPIWNIIVLLEVAGLEWWYMLLMLIPIVNIIILFKVYIDLAHNFGKSTGFGILTVFFSVICMPILAFGDARYQG